MVDIYVKEATVSPVSWEELKCRAAFHVQNFDHPEQLMEVCPLIISEYLRIAYNPQEKCFDVKGRPDAVSVLMGGDIYYDKRYSKEIVGINWSAVYFRLMSAKVPEEIREEIYEKKDLERAIDLINFQAERAASRSLWE